MMLSCILLYPNGGQGPFQGQKVTLRRKRFSFQRCRYKSVLSRGESNESGVSHGVQTWLFFDELEHSRLLHVAGVS